MWMFRPILCVCLWVSIYLTQYLNHVHVHAINYINTASYSDPWVSLLYSFPVTLSPEMQALVGSQQLRDTLQYKRAAFGGAVVSPSGSSSETVGLVVAHPVKACSNLTHPFILNATQQQVREYYQGKIVITQRSSKSDPPLDNCRIGVKAAAIEALGGFMHICAMASDLPDRQLLSGQSDTSPLNIPTAVVDYNVGWALIQTLQANPTLVINATVETTGPAAPAERARIVSMYSALDGAYPGGLIANPYIIAYQGIYHPAMFLTDPTLDPCMNRIFGLTCVGGYVTSFELASEFMGTTDMIPVFPMLRWMDLSYNQLSGPTPCSWSTMSHLKGLVLDQTLMSSFTECCGAMTNLEVLMTDFTSISHIPTCLSNLTNLKVLSMESANLTAPLIDITKWTQLQYIDLTSNQITGAIPNLQFAAHTLTTALFGDNAFTHVEPHAFDDMPVLTQVDIGRNQLSGPLPYFKNTTGLTDLGVDHNGFTGPIPTTWVMPQLLALRGSHNQLSGPLDPLSSCTSMTSLDLSYNQFYNDPTSTYYTGDVLGYFSAVLSTTLTSLQMSHNQFNGTWQNWFQQNNITHIYMSHNNLTALDSYGTFLPLYAAVSQIEIYDLSYNPALTGSLAQVGPTPVLQVFKANGCPLLRDAWNDPPQLPSYVQPSTDQITKNSVTELYSCPSLEGKLYPLQISLDPSYYGYTGCVCDQGTYGQPPNCLVIPVVRNDTANPVTISGNITDEMYGSSRMSIGIDTAWQLGSISTEQQNVTTAMNVTVGNTTMVANVTNNITIGGSTHRIMAIYITITLLPLFNEYADIIDIYAGESISTTPIISIRGNYPRPISSNLPDVVSKLGYVSSDPNMVTFVVLDSHATLNFRSRETSGIHFYANYTLSTTTPPGYYYNPLTMRVEAIPAILPIFSLSNSVVTVVWVVAAVILLLTLCTSAWVMRLRTTVIFKASSVPFCLSMLFSAALMAAGAIFYVLSPERGDYVCDARIWFSTLSLVTLLASLLTKANRIRDIFTNDDLNKPVQTNTHLIRTTMFIVACELILLIGLTASNLAHPQLTLGTKATDGYRVYSCTSVESTDFKVWLAFQLTFIGVFLFSGTYIAFEIRRVPSAFNESASIVNALYVLTLLSVILLPINFIVDDNPNALALIRGVGQCLVSLSMTLALFGPKFYYVLDGRANDTSMVQTSLGVTSKQRTNSGAQLSESARPRKDTGGGGGGGGGGGATRDELFARYLKLESQMQQLETIVRRNGSHDELKRVILKQGGNTQQGRPPLPPGGGGATTTPAAAASPVLGTAHPTKSLAQRHSSSKQEPAIAMTSIRPGSLSEPPNGVGATFASASIVPSTPSMSAQPMHLDTRRVGSVDSSVPTPTHTAGFSHSIDEQDVTVSIRGASPSHV